MLAYEHSLNNTASGISGYAVAVKNLLIVANTPSENTHRLAEATLRGAQSAETDNIDTHLLEPLKATADDVLNADGIIIGTTENFGYMSGQIKDFFERVYYPCLEEKQGLPYALYIKAGLDGTGTRIGVEKIIAGLRWKSINEVTLLKGDYKPDFEKSCEELGLLVATGLDAGVF